MNRVLLIHPPAVRPTEPPIGAGAILGFLSRHGIPARGWDANLAGILRLIDIPPEDSSVRSTQAFQARTGILGSLRSGKSFQSFASHFNGINRLKHLLGVTASSRDGWMITLTNLEHARHHPFQSTSWTWAAEHPEQNPFVSVLAGDLESILSTFNPTHVGFSMNYPSQVLTTFAFSGWLKKRFPQLVQLLGGSLVSSWLAHYPESARCFLTFDHVLPGNAEETLLPILYKTSEAYSNRPRHENFNYTPAFDDFPLMDYLSPSPVIPLSFTRGCYWTKCLFCTEQLEQGNFLMLEPARAVKILAELESRHRPKLFHFGDNAIPPALLQALIRNPLSTPWYGFIRFIKQFSDPDFCHALKKAGCLMLQLGLESGHPGVLENMRKGISPEEAAIALKNLHAAGIGTYVYLLFGTPFEGEAEAGTTLEFVAENSPNIDFLNLAIFSLPIQSPESLETMRKCAVEGNFPLYFDYTHPRGWNKTEIRRFLDRRFKAHPAIRPIIQRKPLCFTSNHGPFFLLKNRRAFTTVR